MKEVWGISSLSECLDLATDALDGYSEERPCKVVSSGNYKVRGNWFQIAIPIIEEAIFSGWITDSSIEEDLKKFIRGFFQRRDDWINTTDTQAHGNLMTTGNEIRKMNSLLRRTIQNLKDSA